MIVVIYDFNLLKVNEISIIKRGDNVGILYDLYYGVRKKKRCTVCGCLLYDDSDFNICECCRDEMNDI